MNLILKGRLYLTLSLLIILISVVLLVLRLVRILTLTLTLSRSQKSLGDLRLNLMFLLYLRHKLPEADLLQVIQVWRIRVKVSGCLQRPT